MKRRVLGLLLFLLIVPFVLGCDQEATAGAVTIEIITLGDDPETEVVETEYVSYSVTAEYLEDDTLFGLLEENFTITYEDGSFGRYLTGIGTLVVAESNEYIAFYINDEYAMTGVDATDLVDGSVYQFRLETF